MTFLFAKKGPLTGGLKLVSRFGAHNSRRLALLLASLTVLSGLLAGIAANAQVIYDVSVKTKYNSSLPLSQALYTLGSVSVNGSSTGNEYAGPLTLTATPHGTSDARSYESYCIGLYETVGVPASYYGSPRLISQPFPPAYEPPSGAKYPDATLRAAVVYGYNLADAAVDLRHGAALQAAIWESMYVNFAYASVTDNTGHLYTSAEYAAFDTLVHQYLSILSPATIGDPQYNAWQWVLHGSIGGTDTKQFLITPVPEPAATAVVVIAFLGLLCGAEIRRRSKPARSVSHC